MHVGHLLSRAAQRVGERPAWIAGDTLPKNAYGKVLKRELRDRFWADRARKV